MSASYVYAGAVAPESLRLEIAAKDSGLDLTTVTAVVFKVARPDLERVEWAATIETATTSTLVCKHPFGAGDVDQVGTYAVFAEMTIPGGTWRTEPRALEVRNPYAKASP